MYKVEPTKNALLLNSALIAVGIETVLEHWDGHKHVDIYIPKGKIYIEIDGPQHYTNPLQIVDDFKRDHYSDDDGFHTMHIPNEVVQKNAIQIARALKKMLNF
jgi:very-short-patch-repair endonuclease